MPFPLTAGELENNLDWIPSVDTLSDELAAIQKHSSFRGFHDCGAFRVEETIQNSRLIGRSVWNSRWLLIIPAGPLHNDRAEGLERFIHGGVSDIKIFFQTYACSGNCRRRRRASSAQRGLRTFERAQEPRARRRLV